MITKAKERPDMGFAKKRETIEILKRAGFASDEAAVLSKSARLVDVKKGDRLTEIGGYSRVVYLLVSGSVDVTKASGVTRSIKASSANPLIIGEISALMDRLYTVASVVATEKAQAVVVPSKKLASLMELSPRLSSIVQSQRSERLDEMHEALVAQRSSQRAAYESYLSALSKQDSR